jgi:hypothetical protein
VAFAAEEGLIPRLVTKGKALHRCYGNEATRYPRKRLGRRPQSAPVAGSRIYLVLFVVVTILASVAIAWIVINPPRNSLTIPPGETRGMIAVCFSHYGAGTSAWAAIDGVERGKVSMGPRSNVCVYPLVPPGNHTVSVTCGSGQSWLTNVTLSSRQVMQLPAPGQSYGCQ